MASISCQHIYKIYPGATAPSVTDFNLEIQDKEFIIFVGPSGCGKSTTLRMIAGLEEISKGEMYIGGRLINDVPPKDRDIAMVFQSYALYPHMTVYKNIAFGLELRKTPKDEIDKRVHEAAKILEIEHLLDRKPKALSGGQRQRVALGRAMVRNPAVFLLDEPLSNLDAKLRTSMRTEIIKLHKKLATTFIYVTHDQTEAMTMGDRIVVMKDGVIQHVGTPRDIYQRPKNVFVATFIGRTNIVNAHVKDGIITFADGYHEHIDALDKAAEQDVRCSIRPEEFIICKDGTDGIHGTVQECTYLGLNTHYTIDTDQGDSVEIVEESSIGEGLKKGEKVLLKVKKEKINVFTKDGGTNLIRSDAYEKQ